MLSLRPAVDADRPLLFELYAASRADELARVAWSDEQKTAFLEHQFQAQDADYKERRPDAEFLVVEWDGEPVGRLYRTMLDGPNGRELRVMDIALLPQWQGRGIGSSLLEDVIAEADRAGVPVTLHVERWNRAVKLYERLGFVERGRSDVHLLLERKPVS